MTGFKIVQHISQAHGRKKVKKEKEEEEAEEGIKRSDRTRSRKSENKR
jgi:hypothetical protein